MPLLALTLSSIGFITFKEFEKSLFTENNIYYSFFLSRKDIIITINKSIFNIC